MRSEIVDKRTSRSKTFDEGWRAALDAQGKVPTIPMSEWRLDENDESYLYEWDAPYLVEALPGQPSTPVLTLECGGSHAHHVTDPALAAALVAAERAVRENPLDPSKQDELAAAREACIRHWAETDCNWHDLGTEFGSGEYPYQVRFNKGTHALTILLPGATVPFTVAPIGRNRKAVPAYSANTITIPNLWPGVTALWLLTPERPVLHFIKTAEPCTDPQVQVIGTDLAPMMSAYYTDKATMESVQVPATLAYGVITYDFAGVPLNVRVV